MKVDYGELLEFIVDLAIVFSRRDCGLVLAGFRNLDSRRDPYRIFRRLEKDQCLAVAADESRFALRPEIVERVRAVSPTAQWHRPWDGKWRLVTYDLPESRRRERILLWRALHARKLGLLQKSVWIWPHNVEALLWELVRTEGVPECFVGVEGDRLLLSSPAELVTAAWDFETIHRRQARYLEESAGGLGAVSKAKSLWDLGRVSRMEWIAYRQAFALDPCLPRVLWPPGYRGEAVQQKHEEFLEAARQRARALRAS